jgi:hypothetical protein
VTAQLEHVDVAASALLNVSVISVSAVAVEATEAVNIRLVRPVSAIGCVTSANDPCVPFAVMLAF